MESAMTPAAIAAFKLLGLPSNQPFEDPEIVLPTLEPGDLVEFDRIMYSHWGMYSDTPEFIINVDAQDKNSTEAKISLEKLMDVAGQSKIRKNNKTDSTHLQLKVRTVEEMLTDAKSCIDTRVPYSFTRQNCEYYVTKWRFGRGFSDQVDQIWDVVMDPAGHGILPDEIIPLNSQSNSCNDNTTSI